MTRPIRVAYGSVPKDGGTFTFYRNLRPALAALGVEMRCVSVGRAQNALVEPAFVDDGCVALAPGARSPKRQARAFADWCETEAIDVVLAINSEGILSALPHLPERIRVVARCANGFDQGYRVTMSGRERLARIVALVPRLRDDLVAGYRADPRAMALIPNGIAPEPFAAAAARRRGTGDRLEIGFLGRLEHNQKGVLHLPGIADALARRGVPFRLRIAGKGRHEPELRAGLAAHIRDGRVEMLGALGPAAVPDFLASVDAFASPRTSRAARTRSWKR
jgi:glycosyltransferase involved in cell wall biosynthesis